MTDFLATEYPHMYYRFQWLQLCVNLQGPLTMIKNIIAVDLYYNLIIFFYCMCSLMTCDSQTWVSLPSIFTQGFLWILLLLVNILQITWELIKFTYHLLFSFFVIITWLLAIFRNNLLGGISKLSGCEKSMGRGCGKCIGSCISKCDREEKCWAVMNLLHNAYEKGLAEINDEYSDEIKEDLSLYDSIKEDHDKQVARLISEHEENKEALRAEYEEANRIALAKALEFKYNTYDTDTIAECTTSILPSISTLNNEKKNIERLTELLECAVSIFKTPITGFNTLNDQLKEERKLYAEEVQKQKEKEEEQKRKEEEEKNKDKIVISSDMPADVINAIHLLNKQREEKYDRNTSSDVDIGHEDFKRRVFLEANHINGKDCPSFFPAGLIDDEMPSMPAYFTDEDKIKLKELQRVKQELASKQDILNVHGMVSMHSQMQISKISKLLNIVTEMKFLREDFIEQVNFKEDVKEKLEMDKYEFSYDNLEDVVQDDKAVQNSGLNDRQYNRLTFVKDEDSELQMSSLDYKTENYVDDYKKEENKPSVGKLVIGSLDEVDAAYRMKRSAQTSAAAHGAVGKHLLNIEREKQAAYDEDQDLVKKANDLLETYRQHIADLERKQKEEEANKQKAELLRIQEEEEAKKNDVELKVSDNQQQPNDDNSVVDTGIDATVKGGDAIVNQPTGVVDNDTTVIQTNVAVDNDTVVIQPNVAVDNDATINQTNVVGDDDKVADEDDSKMQELNDTASSINFDTVSDADKAKVILYSSLGIDKDDTINMKDGKTQHKMKKIIDEWTYDSVEDIAKRNRADFMKFCSSNNIKPKGRRGKFNINAGNMFSLHLWMLGEIDLMDDTDTIEKLDELLEEHIDGYERKQ